MSIMLTPREPNFTNNLLTFRVLEKNRIKLFHFSMRWYCGIDLPTLLQHNTQDRFVSHRNEVRHSQDPVKGPPVYRCLKGTDSGTGPARYRSKLGGLIQNNIFFFFQYSCFRLSNGRVKIYHRVPPCLWVKVKAGDINTWQFISWRIFKELTMSCSEDPKLKQIWSLFFLILPSLKLSASCVVLFRSVYSTQSSSYYFFFFMINELNRGTVL